MIKFRITSSESGERLDKFLASKELHESRSQLQKAIKDGLFLVNDKTATPHYFLKEGDNISIKQENKKAKKQENYIEMNLTHDFQYPISKDVSGNEQISSKKLGRKIKIVKETEEFVVVNKPAGLIVHPDKHIKEYTLVDWLIEKYPKIVKVGDDLLRPGIVHRLDKDASGLMVVALTQDSFDSLKEQFQKRKVKKAYTALVYGQPVKDEDMINFPISRAAAGHRMAALPSIKNGEKNVDGRRALTEFEVIERWVNYTLLKVRIKTGRTHQIRVHMSAYGHPLVGDEIYNTKTTREKNRKLDLGRVFLVADELAFTDLNREEQVFKIQLPNELKKVLNIIK